MNSQPTSNRQLIWLLVGVALLSAFLSALFTAAVLIPDACLESPKSPAVELNMGCFPIRNHVKPERIKR